MQLNVFSQFRWAFLKLLFECDLYECSSLGHDEDERLSGVTNSNAQVEIGDSPIGNTNNGDAVFVSFQILSLDQLQITSMMI